MTTLMKLWILAEKLMIPRLQNEVMDNIILNFAPRIHEFTPVLSTYVYSNTGTETLLRSMVVDFVAQSMSSDHFQKHKGEWNAELLQDLCSSLIDRKRRTSSLQPPPIGIYYVGRSACWKREEATYVEDGNLGTVNRLFVQLVETDASLPHMTNHFENIAASSTYHGKFSNEELRLADYTRHPKKFGRE
jgi:hypothetical protein